MPSRHELIQWGTIKVVGGAATLIVGIYVFGQILNVMPQPETAEMANATNTTVATVSSGFTLGAVALIVLFASIILGLIAGGSVSWGGRPVHERPPRGNGGNEGRPP